MDFVEHFRQNICWLRKSRHLTQKEMAAILGVSVSTIRRIESGAPVRLHCGMVRRFCDHFGISADVLLREKLEEIYCTSLPDAL